MLSLENVFREKMLGLYQGAPLDARSFHRPYKACTGGCAAICCNGGSGFYMAEEPETIRQVVKDNTAFFAKNSIPADAKLFDEEVDEESGTVELCTAIRDITYPAGTLPAHFPSTACIFRRESDAACTLQVLGIEQGKPGWWFKPLACWLFPIELESHGTPLIHVAHASTDEYVDDEYPGFTGYTPCGSECASGGKPAYQVLEKEIAALSKLLGRDLMAEITSYREKVA